MQFVAYKGERSLDDVARRVFKIQGAKAAEQTKQAVAALLEANPHLRDLKNVAEGTPIIVPTVPGLAPAATQGDFTAQVVSSLGETLKNADSVLGRALAREMEEARQMAELAQDKRLAKLAEQSPEIKERLAQTLKAVEEHLKEIETRKKATSEGLSQLQKDLEDLSGN